MMEENNNSRVTNVTFRFASGQILTLNDNQIAKIPYLAAIVSSADRFESARDEDRHYKLDPNIDYQYFSFALESLSFRSVRGFFTRLPEEQDVLATVALLDFLGLIPQPLPTLREVDSTFFSNMTYSPHCGEYLQIVKYDILQDMAVRFTIALIKEEYDFGQCEVMDQIYWFVMFILSAPKWFGSRIRYHVYTTAKNCFAVFKPSLSKALEGLVRTFKRESCNYSSLLLDTYFPRTGNYTYSCLSTEITFYDEQDEYPNRYLFSSQSSDRKISARFIRSVYEGKGWFSCTEEHDQRDILKVIHGRVLEIMYIRLQSEIYHRVVAEFQRQRNLYKYMRIQSYLPTSCYLFDHAILSKKIGEIIKTEHVQEEIDALVLKDLCYLIPKLEHEHAKLVQSFEEDEEVHNIWGSLTRFLISWQFLAHQVYESKREKISRYRLLLDKLHEDQYSIVEETRKRVLHGLSEIFLQQLKQWENTQRKIDEFESSIEQFKQYESLNPLIRDIKLNRGPSDFLRTEKKKSKNHQYQLNTSKLSLNRHFKHSWR